MLSEFFQVGLRAARDMPCVAGRVTTFRAACFGLFMALGGSAGVMAAQAVSATAPVLPPEVEAALVRSRLPREALSVVVVDAQGGRAPARLAHRAQVPVNPASVMKLVTTYAALEQLGPAYVWNTPVYVQGTVQDGSLRGNVYIQGQGDPRW